MLEQFGVKKPKRNILVVDDEHVLQKMIHTILTRQGYSVMRAANGVIALDAAMRRQVDLVGDYIDLIITPEKRNRYWLYWNNTYRVSFAKLVVDHLDSNIVLCRI